MAAYKDQKKKKNVNSRQTYCCQLNSRGKKQCYRKAYEIQNFSLQDCCKVYEIQKIHSIWKPVVSSKVKHFLVKINIQNHAMLLKFHFRITVLIF